MDVRETLRWAREQKRRWQRERISSVATDNHNLYVGASMAYQEIIQKLEAERRAAAQAKPIRWTVEKMYAACRRVHGRLKQYDYPEARKILERVLS